MLAEFNLTNDKRSQTSNHGAPRLGCSIGTGATTMAYGLMMEPRTLKLFANSSGIHGSLIRGTMVEITVHRVRKNLLCWIKKVSWNGGLKLNNGVKEDQPLSKCSENSANS